MFKKYASCVLAIILVSLIVISGCSKKTEQEDTITDDSSIENIINNYDGLFAKDQIKEINVNISEDDFQTIINNPKSGDYYNTTVNIDSDEIQNVGFCTKGNLSLKSLANSSSDRYSFAFQFDQYVDDQKYKGISSFCVNNGFADPSFLREYLAYEMLASIGSPTPLCALARLSINGEYYGLYTMVERTDENFIKRVFKTEDTVNHYEAEMGSSLASEDSLKNFNLLSGDDTDFNELKTLVSYLENLNDDNYKDIESILDVDSVLKYIAGNVACGSYDSYLSEQAQNYEFVQINGKLQMIPWDYNMAFGGFVADQGKSASIDIDEPFLDGGFSQLPLLKLINYPEYKEKYYGYLKQCEDYLNGIEERINKLADLIRNDVYNDPTKLYTNEEFEAELVYSEISSNSESSFDNNGPGEKRTGGSGGPGQRENGGDSGGSDNYMKPKVTLMTYAKDILSNIKSQLESK